MPASARPGVSAGFPIGLIGEAADLTYDYLHLGTDTEALAALADGQGDFAKILGDAKNPLIIVGEGAVSHAGLGKQAGRDVLALAAQIANNAGALTEEWNGFAMLHNAASRVGGLDIGFVPHDGGVCSADQIAAAGQGDLDVLFLLGADEYDMQAMGEAFVVYIGSHGDAGAHRADVILPAAAYTEKSATYVNTEGRVQQTTRASSRPATPRKTGPSSVLFRPMWGSRCPTTRLISFGPSFTSGIRIWRASTISEAGDAAAVARLAAKPSKATSVVLTSPVRDYY